MIEIEFVFIISCTFHAINTNNNTACGDNVTYSGSIPKNSARVGFDTDFSSASSSVFGGPPIMCSRSEKSSYNISLLNGFSIIVEVALIFGGRLFISESMSSECKNRHKDMNTWEYDFL